jgi:exodeoxyribonuclease-3
VRRGIGAWVEAARPDILCLQEVRAPDADLTAAFAGSTVEHEPSLIKGRSGVAIVTGLPVGAVRRGLGLADETHSGRWIEADVELPELGGPVTVVSAYVHTGGVGSPKQAAKYEFLDAMTERLAELAGAGQAVVCGDFNIAHHEADLKNWRGNIGKRGFLVEERAYLDRWLDEMGWADVTRRLAGDREGPYTWWSWRGQAFVNDSGWRIDYQLVTPGLAGRAQACAIGRAAAYESRWSDHAPVTVDYS